MKISVVIPTHNRHEKLRETVGNLRRQDFSPAEYEIVVVDDGSLPAVAPQPEWAAAPQVSIVRLEGAERSVARNTGAGRARGELVVFVDDDIAVGADFLSAYWQAHREFPDALLVGAILLPEEMADSPFIRFRHRLEQQDVPMKRGVVEMKNFCAAGNAAAPRERFLSIRGFDEKLSSSEDQDFALRYTAAGGRIVYVPECRGIHHDSALDIRAYCRRSEWGIRLMRPFCERYPELPENISRETVNGFARWGREPVAQSVRKGVKSVLAADLTIAALFRLADMLERRAPDAAALDRIYRLLLGAHIFRGYRAGQKEARAAGETAKRTARFNKAGG